MRSEVQVASAFFIGVNFLLALAIGFGTFYIFIAVRQFGSIYSALFSSRQPLSVTLRRLRNRQRTIENDIEFE